MYIEQCLAPNKNSVHVNTYCFQMFFHYLWIFLLCLAVVASNSRVRPFSLYSVQLFRGALATIDVP